MPLVTALVLALGAALAPAGRDEPLRIACLGDSITFGARIADREHHAYPAQLQQRLGAGFEVRNFGVGGATLLVDADRPYVETEAFRAALEWRPDLAIVILGTNDTVQSEARGNWEHADGLAASARELVGRLRGDGETPAVWLCSPPPMFPEAPGLSAERAADLRERAIRLAQVAEVLRDVATDLPGVEYVDLTRTLDVGHVVDGVHTTPFGAEALAERLRELIELPRWPPLDLAELLAAGGIHLERSDFGGFRRFDFRLPDDGPACILVAPHGAPAAGRPWIWRARFFGHQPALDLALLERGFHLGYVDVVDLYGAPQAVARMQRFHDLCVELGLARRAALEGMSRGGLAVLNFARENDGAVAAIYLDNPVCDIRSWPGGRHGQRSDEDWRRCKQAYGLGEEAAWSFDRGPLARLADLADERVPVLLVMGSADEVVPPDENGALLAERYTALGGPTVVWRKPGLGHHPHGLHPPAPLTRAIQRACGLESLPTTRATPSAEYRGSPAGWGGGSWWDQLEKLRELAAEHPDLELVFLGDSISQGLTGAGDRLAHPDGTRAFDRYHGERRAASLGLSGDRTEHLLYRIEHGALATLRPRLIVLQIGVNNVNAAGHTGEEVHAGIQAVLDLLRGRLPQAEIVVCGPFPTAHDPADPRRGAIDRVLELLQRNGAGERALYLDLRPLFLDEVGRPNERMAADAIHITPAGQEAWLEALEPLLCELLDG